MKLSWKNHRIQVSNSVFSFIDGQKKERTTGEKDWRDYSVKGLQASVK